MSRKQKKTPYTWLGGDLLFSKPESAQLRPDYLAVPDLSLVSALKRWSEIWSDPLTVWRWWRSSCVLASIQVLFSLLYFVSYSVAGMVCSCAQRASEAGCLLGLRFCFWQTTRRWQWDSVRDLSWRPVESQSDNRDGARGQIGCWRGGKQRFKWQGNQRPWWKQRRVG